MKHHDREYSTRISSLRVLLRDSRPDISRIEQHIDAIITTKKAYTNDLRLESNREIRAQGESMLAQQDEEVRGILSSAPQVVQACPKVKVLRDLIDRSTMYINLEGKGNAQLLDGAKGKDEMYPTITYFVRYKTWFVPLWCTYIDVLHRSTAKNAGFYCSE
jgi:hypothetical protein